MNNKGFTLSELIVTIAIMGVITMIAYPAIDKLQTEHEKDLYRTYEKSLQTGAKLYADKYSRDMFYENDEGKCVKVAFGSIEDEGFVKKFDRKGANVNTDDTYVIIRKQKADEQTLTYDVYLKIEKEGKLLYESPSNSGCSVNFP